MEEGILHNKHSGCGCTGPIYKHLVINPRPCSNVESDPSLFPLSRIGMFGFQTHACRCDQGAMKKLSVNSSLPNKSGRWNYTLHTMCTNSVTGLWEKVGRVSKIFLLCTQVGEKWLQLCIAAVTLVFSLFAESDCLDSLWHVDAA